MNQTVTNCFCGKCMAVKPHIIYIGRQGFDPVIVQECVCCGTKNAQPQPPAPPVMRQGFKP